MVALKGNGWKLAPCLAALFAQADARWPGRSTASDGSIGDSAHAARKSDHNPEGGIVHAGDLTNDPAHGVHARAIAQHLLDVRAPRVKYCISEGEAWYSYATSTHPAFRWVKYTGPNGHFHHVHISVKSGVVFENDLSPWFPTQEGNSNAPQEDDMTPAQEALLNEAVDRLRKIHAGNFADGDLSWLDVRKNEIIAACSKPGGLTGLNDADLAAIADAVNDELARRQSN